MEHFTYHTIRRCVMIILMMVIFENQHFGINAAETSPDLDKLLESSIEKILTEKFGLTNSQIKKSTVNNNNASSNTDNTTSLMEMVKNIMKDSGSINNASTNTTTTDTQNSDLNDNRNSIEKQILSILQNNSNSNSVDSNKNDNGEAEGLQNVLSDFIKSSLTNKIDEARKQILTTIFETIDESIPKNNNTAKKKNQICVDIYKECKDLKKSGVCKTSRDLMMKNCKDTCGFCHKKVIIKKPKTKKIKKLLIKKKLIKKQQTKKKLTAKQKLHKKYKCPLHCKRHCTSDCPKYCCKTNEHHSKKPKNKRCGPLCPRSCAPDCSAACCFPKRENKINNIQDKNYNNNNALNTFKPGVCLNDVNCPSLCYPQCNPKCCQPDSDAVNLLTESFLNNLNNANFDQRNEIASDIQPQELPQVPTSLEIPPLPTAAVIPPFPTPQTCPLFCSDNTCDNKVCPSNCCNENEITFVTTARPINANVNDDGHYLSNSNEIVLTSCPKDCMYNCTDACFRNKCCDKK